MGFSNWLRRKGKPDKDKAQPVRVESALESEKDSKETSQNGNMESRQQQPEQDRGFFGRLKNGLERTRSAFVARVDTLLSSHKSITEELFEELEEILIQADVGVETTLQLVDEVRTTVKARGVTDPAKLRPILQERIQEILSVHTAPLTLPDTHPAVIMVVGVNGAGKTTTIGKLAYRFKSEGKKVLLGAADTFRAAAIEQLEIQIIGRCGYH